MLALPPHKKIEFYGEGHVWFAPCHECGIYVASGIEFHVNHALKYHNLGAITDSLCSQMAKKKKSVSEMTELECELLLATAFYDVPIMKENPDLEGMSMEEMFAYHKKKHNL